MRVHIIGVLMKNNFISLMQSEPANIPRTMTVCGNASTIFVGLLVDSFDALYHQKNIFCIRCN
jgi:hypothetical protein